MTNCLCFIEQEPGVSPGTALSAGVAPAALVTPVWPQCPCVGPTGVAQEHQLLVNLSAFPLNFISPREMWWAGCPCPGPRGAAEIQEGGKTVGEEGKSTWKWVLSSLQGRSKSIINVHSRKRLNELSGLLWSDFCSVKLILGVYQRDQGKQGGGWERELSLTFPHFCN